MSQYTIIDKKSGEEEEIEASSAKHALYKKALDRTKTIANKKARKQITNNIYGAMLKSHEALLLNDPNQMTLPL
jgi:di/tripeptidase